MPRPARVAPGGMIFHVLNRGVGRMRLFLKDADFEAFERVFEKTLVTNQPQTDAELDAIRKSVIREQPYGDAEWVDSTAKRLGWDSTLRSRGRSKKENS